MFTPATVVSLLWLVWIVIWVGAAFTAARIAERAPGPERFAERVLLTGGAILLFLHPAAFGVLLRPSLPAAHWLRWTGVVLTLLGLGVAVWARFRLGRLWSGVAAIKVEHSLIRTGPYAVVRHPIYSGMLLALLGSAIARGTLGALVGLVLLGIGLALRVRHEESLLVAHFGDAYRRYRQEVPAVVPRFRALRESR
jgi:protein-S-isoprenylcysteine O-methyltransferase Ste14